MPSIPQPRILPRHRGNSNDNRVSAYWHIPTAGGTELLFRRSNERPPPALKSPGVPLLAADIIAQRLLTPEVTPEPTPLAHPATTTTTKPPKELTAKQALLARITKGAAKYAEQLTRPAGHDPRLPPERPPPPQNQHAHEPLTLQAIQDMLSPPPPSQRLPSPPKRPTHAARPSLGWSSAAKQAFDSSNGHRQQQQQRQQQHKPSVTAYTHVVAPARPLDERGMGVVADEERPGVRRGSLFSSLRELRRQVKAEKRREDIKRSIRVVAVPGEVEVVRGRSAEGQREREDDERPAVASGWGRRMSWIGGGMV